MSQFRSVEEDHGATLPIEDTVPAVGTWKLFTCLGVYFKIDKSRCFVAHINTPSKATYPFNVVTDQAGRKIVSRVVKAFNEIKARDKWDVLNREFGKDFLVQCPGIDDIRVEDHRYKRGARFALQGINEFFKSCADFVERELKLVLSDSQNKKLPQDEAKAFNARQMLSEAKAMYLRSQGVLDQVDKIHHCFIVTPSTGQVIRLDALSEKSVKDQNCTEDLCQNSPVTVELKDANFLFLEREDKCHEFHPRVRNQESLEPSQEAMNSEDEGE